MCVCVFILSLSFLLLVYFPYDCYHCVISINTMVLFFFQYVYIYICTYKHTSYHSIVLHQDQADTSCGLVVYGVEKSNFQQYDDNMDRWKRRLRIGDKIREEKE